MWIFRIHFKIAPELCHIKNDETSKKIESITIKSKKMKKIVALFVCLLAVSLSVRADDDRPIQFEQLPSKAQAFVKEHFPQEKVALAKMEKDFFDKKYEVIFANSSKVEFLKDGNWKEVDCKYSSVPEAVLPNAINQYVKTNYAGQKVLKIEKEDRGGYEIKLSGGLELGFDKRFQLIDIDN